MGILRKTDETLKFYEGRSNGFTAEVKNLLKINVPDIEPVIAEYLAGRIDIIRLQYEAALIRKLNKTLDERDRIKNVYEVTAQEAEKIRTQPAVSKSFLDNCKNVAQKYRRKCV